MFFYELFDQSVFLSCLFCFCFLFFIFTYIFVISLAFFFFFFFFFPVVVVRIDFEDNKGLTALWQMVYFSGPLSYIT